MSDDRSAAGAAADVHLRAAIAAGSCATFEYDIDARTIQWVDAVGWVSGEPQFVCWDAAAFTAMLEPADRLEMRHAVRKALRTGRLDVRFHITQADGRMRCLRARGQLLRDQLGRRATLIGIILDIAEEKQIEAQLRAREEHLRLILETVPDAMIIIDEVGAIQSFSQAAERLFGWRAEEAVDLIWAPPVDEVYPPGFDTTVSVGAVGVVPGPVTVSNPVRVAGDRQDREPTAAGSLSGRAPLAAGAAAGRAFPTGVSTSTTTTTATLTSRKCRCGVWVTGISPGIIRHPVATKWSIKPL